VTHEGLAAYREMCWIASNEGVDSARQYLNTVPEFYRDGIDKVTKLVGNPFDDPYQGLSPPVFHILLITLGIALMNTPILAHYNNPEQVFQESLSWLLVDGPDQRLDEFCKRSETFHGALHVFATEIEEALLARFPVPTDMVELDRLYTLGLGKLRQPDIPMVSRHEFTEQAGCFNTNWINYLNLEAGREVARRGDKRKDMTGERLLSIRISPADYAQTELALTQENAITVKYTGLVGIAEGRQTDDIVRLTMIVTHDQDSAMERLLELRTSMLSMPMVATYGCESPWASFEPSIYCECSVEQFLNASQELSDFGWCWYTNQTIITFLRELKRMPDGFLFEHCQDAQHVLLALDHIRRLGSDAKGYVVGRFADQEPLVGIVYENLLSFSFIMDVGLNTFLEAANQQGLEEFQEDSLTIGARDFSIEQVSRWARWATFGG